MHINSFNNILHLIPKGLQMEVPVLPAAHSDFDVAVVGLAGRMGKQEMLEFKLPDVDGI